MAIKGRSAEQKAALAEIVASETLLDIEEYIRPQFPPKRTSNEVLARENDLVNLNLYARRRIVQDGHGKWREVKPQLYSSNLQDLTSPVPSVKLKRRGDDGKTIPSRLVHCTESFNGSSVKTSGNYNNLSMTLRSNVFPGLGNNQWKTTTAKVFTEQPVIPTSERDKFCGIQSDEFGKWSAANVHHERMKKKWDAYLDTLPKQAAGMKPQIPKEVTPKVEKPPPQAKVKKTNPKAKPQKKEQKPPSTCAESTVMPEDIPPVPPPIDIPAADDNFWDFYDKPFNKPN